MHWKVKAPRTQRASEVLPAEHFIRPGNKDKNGMEQNEGGREGAAKFKRFSCEKYSCTSLNFVEDEWL